MILNGLNPGASIWPFLLIDEVTKWLNPLVHLVGLGIAVWAYLRCHKCGYLVVSIYFAVCVFMLLAMPPINRAIAAHREPDVSEETQKKINAAVQEAIDRVVKEEGQPYTPVIRHKLNLPLCPILLVVGLWLLAKREPRNPNMPPHGGQASS
jgi:hypothetical protein